MAKQVTNNAALALLKKAGADKSFTKHRNDSTEFDSGGDLPAGINNGVAQAVSAKLDVYKEGANKGKPYLLISGIVKQPAEYEGMRASKLIGLHENRDGSKTVDDRIAEALNEVRKLGYDTKGLTLDDFEDLLSSIGEEKPHFRFRTWASDPTPAYPNPRTNLTIRGPAEGFEEESSEEDDEEVEEEETEEEEEEIEDEDAEETDEDSEGDEEEDEEEEESDEEESEEEEDLMALGKLADKNDDDAIERLTELAQESEIDPDDYGTWVELAEVLSESGEEDEEEEEESEEEEEEEESSDDISVGDVFYYTPKGSKKPVEVVIKKVVKKNEKFDIETVDPPVKKFPGVSVDDLSGE